MKHKRLRDMSWDDYGISKNRYKELKAFCLQYDEKKNKIQYGMNSSRQDGMPRGSRSASSPVEQQAIENTMYLRDIRMIEEAAVKANPVIWKYILKSVTQGTPYEYIEYDAEQGKIPMGKTDFNANRRLFYHYLDLLQIGFKLSAETC